MALTALGAGGMGIEELRAALARMSPQQRQQVAMMYKNSPYASIVIPLAQGISQEEQQLRQAMQAQQMGMQQPPKVVDQAIAQMAPQMPEDQGIAVLPTPNMEQMADGGIVGGVDDGYDMAVGYAYGGEVERYQSGGRIGRYEALIRDEAVRQGMDPDLAVRLFMTESSGDPNAVSPKGAVGLGQLMPAAAREMGLDPKERTDPEKNVRASVGYFVKQQQKYGDPALAAAAYNWGPGNLDKHLQKNEGRLNVAGLPKETANYLTKLMPVREAVAEDRAGAPLTEAQRNALIAQIPGQTEAGRQTTPQKDYTLGQRAIGAGETALSFLSGIPATVLGGAQTLREGIGSLIAGAPAPSAKRLDENVGRFVYSPRTEAGREMTEAAGRAVAEAVPPYIPSVGIPSRAAAAARAAREAEAAAAEAAGAGAKVARPRLAGPGAQVMTPEEAAAAKAKVESPRLAAPGATPEQEAAGLAALQADREAAALARQRGALSQQEQARQQAQMAAMAADEEALRLATGRAGSTAEEAARLGVQAERTATDAARQRAAEQRLGATGMAAAAAGTATPAAAKPAPVSPDQVKALPEEEKKTIIDAAQKAAPDAAEKGWTKDDWLTFGFSMLANKSPYFMEALGTAGLKTLVGRKEREESATAKLLKEAQAEKYKADAEYLKGERVREALRKRALQLSQTQINALKSSARAAAMTPEQLQEESMKIYNNVYNQLLQQQGLAAEGGEAPTATPSRLPSTPPAGAVQRIQ